MTHRLAAEAVRQQVDVVAHGVGAVGQHQRVRETASEADARQRTCLGASDRRVIGPPVDTAGPSRVCVLTIPWLTGWAVRTHR